MEPDLRVAHAVNCWGAAVADGIVLTAVAHVPRWPDFVAPFQIQAAQFLLLDPSLSPSMDAAVVVAAAIAAPAGSTVVVVFAVWRQTG